MRTDESRTVARARVPLRQGSDAYTVQYYAEALAPSGAVIGTLASAASPLTVAVPEDIPQPSVNPALLVAASGETPPPRGSSVLEEWWFWTIVGAVVLGGAAVGVGVGMASLQGPGPGSLGEGHL